MALPIELIAPTLKTHWEEGLRSNVDNEKKPFKSFQDPLTEESLLKEIEGLVKGVEKLIGNISGMDPNDFRWPADLSSHQASFGKAIRRYAVEGIFPNPSDDDYLDFAVFIRVARIAEMYAEEVPARCEHVFSLAILRARLDAATIDVFPDMPVLEPDDDKFSLFEIAVLAHMNEKAVRNATQPTSPDRLKTFKENGSVYVDADEALRWLLNRRDFSVTRTKESLIDEEKGVLPMYLKARYSDDFHFTHSSGDKLYPVRMKNRETGRMAFRLSLGGNKKSDMVEVDNSQDALRMVESGYGVRCSTTDGNRSGIYSAKGRSVKLVKIKH